jgi:biotin carboxylase
MKYVSFVIKPAVGFFSIGVHIVENEKDWIKAKSELQPDKLKSIFPENVLNTSNFIIEEFIRGEEYAIDYYYDNNGDVLLNVLPLSLRNRYK